MMLWGESVAASAGSRTISRILPRTNSAAVSLDRSLNSRSLNEPMKVTPPFAQRASYSRWRASGEASTARASLIGNSSPVGFPQARWRRPA